MRRYNADPIYVRLSTGDLDWLRGEAERRQTSLCQQVRRAIKLLRKVRTKKARPR